MTTRSSVLPSPVGLDTNILGRFLVNSDPQHVLVNDAMNYLIAAQTPFFTTFQNIAECWNILTRPLSDNGFGVTPIQAERGVARLETLMTVLTETPVAYRHWLYTVRQQQVLGKQVHDARLASVFVTSGVTHLLTLNAKDFKRFGVAVVTPDEIIAQGRKASENQNDNP